MVQEHQFTGTGAKPANQLSAGNQLRILRHSHVCQKLQISRAKLFDMVARGHFPKPFQLVPGGRAVGWVEADIDTWILSRKESSEGAVA